MSLGHWWIIALILVVVLIIWGPGKLPDVGAGLGRAIREFRAAQNEVKDSVSSAASTPQAPANPAQSPSSTTPPPEPVSGAPAVGEEAAASSTADEKRSS